MSSRPDARAAFLAALLAAFGLLVGLMVVPFLSALLAVLLVAFLLQPAQRRLAPRLGARPTALLLVVGAVGALGALLALLGASLPADAAELSRAVERVASRRGFEERLERVLGVDVPLGSILADLPRRGVDLLFGDFLGIVGAATRAFLALVLFLFLLYYLLVDGDRLVAWTERMLPLRPEMTEELHDEASTVAWAVLKGHVAVAVIQGAVAGVGLLVVGLPNVVFWTVAMMFLELFPVVGVAGVLGPAVIYLVLTGRLVAAGFLLVYGLTAVAVVDDYLRAHLVDRQSSLHPAVVLLGVFGGVYAFGIMGLFYGPIVLGVFAVLVRLFDQHYVAGT